MKKCTFLPILLFIFAVEIMALFIFAARDTDVIQDVVLINEAVQSVQTDWDTIGSHKNQTNLDYVVLDTNGIVLFKTKSGLSESINRAIIHRDTILDIQVNSSVVGKIIVNNNSSQTIQAWKQTIIMVFFVAILVQCSISIGYSIYLNRIIITPFQKLKGFEGVLQAVISTFRLRWTGITFSVHLQKALTLCVLN